MNWIIAHLVAEFLLQPEALRLSKRNFSRKKYLGMRTGAQLKESEKHGYLDDPQTKKYYPFKTLVIEQNDHPVTSYDIYVIERVWKPEGSILLHGFIWMLFIGLTMQWLTPWIALLGVSHYLLERFDLTTFMIKLLRLKTNPTENYKQIISNVLHLALIWIFVMIFKV